MTPPPRRVLILCTGNSCRSQMAEGLWRELGGDRWEVHSAGTQPAGWIHSGAIAAMDELGIDIRAQSSKSLDAYVHERFDLVVTVCSAAAQNCPVFSNAAEVVHWPTDDPSQAAGPDDETRKAAFRRARDELRDRIAQWLRDHGTT